MTAREKRKPWVQAGGPHQFPFMGAASRSLSGEGPIECPKCHQGTIRAYFHMFKPEARTGTIWVWCAACRTVCHLPRVTPKVDLGPDPFASLSLAQFGALEADASEPFLDRLERLWHENELGFHPTTKK